jgi:hypothetical protein
MITNPTARRNEQDHDSQTAPISLPPAAIALEQALSAVDSIFKTGPWSIDGCGQKFYVSAEFSYPEIPPQRCYGCTCDNAWACPDYDWGDAAGSETETVATTEDQQVAEFIASALKHVPDVLTSLEAARLAVGVDRVAMLDEVQRKDAELRQKDDEIASLKQALAMATQMIQAITEQPEKGSDRTISNAHIHRLEQYATVAARGRWVAKKTNDVAKTLPPGSYIAPNGMFIEAVELEGRYWVTPWTDLDPDGETGWEDYRYIAAANPDTVLALINRFRQAEAKVKLLSVKSVGGA